MDGSTNALNQIKYLGQNWIAVTSGQNYQNTSGHLALIETRCYINSSNGGQLRLYIGPTTNYGYWESAQTIQAQGYIFATALLPPNYYYKVVLESGTAGTDFGVYLQYFG